MEYCHQAYSKENRLDAVVNTFLQFLSQNFGYPLGGLYSNLIASAILGAAGFVYGRAFEKRSIYRHRELMNSHTLLHKKLDDIREK
jgi:hypothetical protein